MNTNNHDLEPGQKNKYGGALPFFIFFGGLVALLIIIKLIIG
jgi:hypothetical protein